MFLAVTPPEEVLVDLETFLEPRVDADPDLRWARPEQWHLTLAFLPSVSPLSLERLAERLDELSLQTEPFDLRLTGGGAFPGTADARLEVSFRADPQQWPADLLAAEGRTS